MDETDTTKELKREDVLANGTQPNDSKIKPSIARFMRIVGLVALVLGTLIGLLAVLRWAGFSIAEFLAIPKAVLVWPAAVLVLGLVLLLRFSGSIDHIIRFGRFSLGGIEIQSQAPATEETPPPPQGLTLTPEQQEELAKFIQSLQQQSEIASTQSQEARTLFERALRNAVLWEFRYLELFFVPTTKRVLAWLVQFPSIRRSFYETAWQQLIPNPAEREVILDVFMAYEVAREDDGAISVTPKGKAFLEFLGVPTRPVSHPPG